MHAKPQVDCRRRALVLSVTSRLPRSFQACRRYFEYQLPRTFLSMMNSLNRRYETKEKTLDFKVLCGA
jgi:hypothetical protein